MTTDFFTHFYNSRLVRPRVVEVRVEHAVLDLLVEDRRLHRGAERDRLLGVDGGLRLQPGEAADEGYKIMMAARALDHFA